MSRHSFDQNDGGSLAIGWDAGMSTFFLQLDEDEEPPSMWAGNEYAQYLKPDDLVVVARLVSSDMPNEIMDILLTDKANDPAWPSVDERFADGSINLILREAGRLPIRMPRTTTFRSLWQRITGAECPP